MVNHQLFIVKLLVVYEYGFATLKQFKARSAAAHARRLAMYRGTPHDAASSYVRVKRPLRRSLNHEARLPPDGFLLGLVAPGNVMMRLVTPLL